MTLFEHLDALTVHKKEYDSTNTEQAKTYVPFMINRFVSMTDIYIPFVAEINNYPDIPKETHYRYYSKILPKRKQFFKYIKKKKDINLEVKQKLCEYFECSLKEVERHIDILNESQIKEITSIFK